MVSGYGSRDAPDKKPSGPSRTLPVRNQTPSRTQKNQEEESPPPEPLDADEIRALQESMNHLSLGDAIIRADPTALELADRNKTRKDNQLRWTKAALDLEPSVPALPVTRKDIDANFFEVTFDENKDIRKYRIELGPVMGRTLVKRDLKRALIIGLLKA